MSDPLCLKGCCTEPATRNATYYTKEGRPVAIQESCDEHGGAPFFPLDAFCMPFDRGYTLGRLQVDAIDALGKRALALVMKHEWASSVMNSYDEHEAYACPECGGWDPSEHHNPVDVDATTGHRGHKPDCEWGRIVAAARALG